MLLYTVYRRAETAVLDEKMPEDFRDIFVMTTLGAREVYPIDMPPASVGEDGSRATEHPGEHVAAKEPSKNETKIEKGGEKDGDCIGPVADSAV